MIENFKAQLDEVILKMRMKLENADIAELKNSCIRLPDEYLKKGCLTYLSLQDHKNSIVLSEEISKLLTITFISGDSVLLILDKESDMGMHLDDFFTDDDPRLLISLKMPKNKKCYFQIKDKNVNLDTHKYVAFNPSKSLHSAWNLSTDDEWVLLGLKLINCPISKDYELYE